MHLDVPLRELAETAGLRAVVAEHGADHQRRSGPGPHVHPMLDIRAHDPGRRLRPQRPLGALLFAARGPADAEHLLLDRVAALAKAAREELDPLEERRLDPVEGIARAQVARRAPRRAPSAGPSSGRRSRVPRGAVIWRAIGCECTGGRGSGRELRPCPSRRQAPAVRPPSCGCAAVRLCFTTWSRHSERTPPAPGLGPSAPRG